ncbi:MAG: acyl-CoA dehydrogenase family protein [Acidobacteria bacterium]|nr:acyl-CoA dehydrogenase family protein [Acidobacteriota bacterium]MCB9396632.1 acyl-CoA dehydrogenase family protein [Acidobacteriota bacterium]
MLPQSDDLNRRCTALLTLLEPLESDFLLKGPESVESELQRIRQQNRADGFWAPALPKEWGGMGLALPEFALLSEQLGRSPFGHYAVNCQAPDIGNMELLLGFGSPEQQERFLKPLIAGQVRSCFAMTEPENAGSNPTLLQARARQEGSDYVINAHKWFTSSADGASFAIVMARTEPESVPDHKAFSQILVPLDTPGFELVRNVSIMGDVGSGYFSHAETRFSECRVPVSNRIGVAGSGFQLAQQRLGPGRIHHCMRWLGMGERAIEMMARYARSRPVSAHETLADKQVIRHWIAEGLTELQAGRLMVLQAAHQLETLGSKAARIEISMIKYYVAGLMHRILDRAVQVHGGLGMTDDTILSFWFRHERAARIYDGPDEVHKDVIAREYFKQLESKDGG